MAKNIIIVSQDKKTGKWIGTCNGVQIGRGSKNSNYYKLALAAQEHKTILELGLRISNTNIVFEDALKNQSASDLENGWQAKASADIRAISERKKAMSKKGTSEESEKSFQVMKGAKASKKHSDDLFTVYIKESPLGSIKMVYVTVRNKITGQHGLLSGTDVDSMVTRLSKNLSHA